jgi:phosphoribosylformimino-5-aminoimidazole carboxamide ribotide isomerase
MRVIPVLDLDRGRAVYARGGERAAYAPVRSRLVSRAGDALGLARAYVQQLRATEVYVADLDAIAGGAMQRDVLLGLAGIGAHLWVDAGITTADGARAALSAGADRVIVGLETLPSFHALSEVARAAGAERVVFSLDLRHGVPIVRHGGGVDDAPLSLVERAVRAGASAVIVLDLGRVGTSEGVDLTLIREIRGALPAIELVAGGGVRGPRDLEQLADAGCDAALVATALHTGSL